MTRFDEEIYRARVRELEELDSYFYKWFVSHGKYSTYHQIRNEASISFHHKEDERNERK